MESRKGSKSDPEVERIFGKFTIGGPRGRSWSTNDTQTIGSWSENSELRSEETNKFIVSRKISQSDPEVERMSVRLNVGLPRERSRSTVHPISCHCHCCGPTTQRDLRWMEPMSQPLVSCSQNSQLGWEETTDEVVLLPPERTRFYNDTAAFALVSGLLPSAWDHWADFMFARGLEESGHLATAGLSYLCIAGPAVYLCIIECLKRWPLDKLHTFVAFAFLTLPWGILCFIAQYYISPTIFKYPAYLFTVFSLAVKAIAVVNHDKRIKKLSMKLSAAESAYESVGQLLIRLYVWIAGGEISVISVITSIIFIGKVAAENFLTSGHHNLLDNKTFCEKWKKICKLIPVMAATAYFNIGSRVIVISYFLDLSSTVHYFWLTQVSMVLVVFLGILLLRLVAPWSSKVRTLSILDMANGLRDMSIHVWGQLGRTGSRRMQLAMATFWFLTNTWLVSWVLVQETGQVSVYSTLCQQVLVCGLASYVLTIGQVACSG